MSIVQEILTVGNIDAAVKRTNRKKTAAIKVEKGRVSITVPKHLSGEQIRDFLSRKERWITNKLEQQADASHPWYQNSRHLQSGEHCFLLGKTLTLAVTSGENESVELIDDKLLLCVKLDKNHTSYKKALLGLWYQNYAKRVLNEKVATFSTSIGVTPKDVIVKHYKSRWGSCSAKGSIYFNWRIIMAPESVVDYVVVHELCHLIHFNHSPSFWQEVERHMSEYRQSQHWLKTNGFRLEI
jgi:predicted metal-dependent hydrolase